MKFIAVVATIAIAIFTQTVTAAPGQPIELRAAYPNTVSFDLKPEFERSFLMSLVYTG
jgi:hypothetical protein